MCQPGRPAPNSVSQDGSPSFLAFHRAKSWTLSFSYSSVSTRWPGTSSLEVDLGERAVGGELGDAEVVGALLLVGVTLFDQSLDDGHHLRDVLCRPGISVGPGDLEPVDVLGERLDEGFGVFPEADAPGIRPLDGLVVDIGDVHDVGYAEAAEDEEPLEKVLENVGPEVADVRVVVDRRPAGVELCLARDDRDERLLLPAQRVKECDHVANNIGVTAGGVKSSQVAVSIPF